MESHCSQCLQEPVECPYAEAGCKEKLKRSQLGTHMASSVQEHLSLITNDYQETKRELVEVKGELLEVKGELLEVKGILATLAVQLLRQGTEADKEMIDFVIACSVRLERIDDLVKVSMPKFSEYRRSGKVWYSPPFYYRDGYKMCLAVYANGVKGAGTHVSVILNLLKGEHNISKQQPEKKCRYHELAHLNEGSQYFNVCRHQPLSQYSEATKELSRNEKFCTHNYIVSKLVSGCLTFSIKYVDNCHLLVSVN